MRFEVGWLEEAYDDLANLWPVHVGLRREINEASNRAEEELKRDAHLKGTPIDNYRALRVWPLLVLYTVIVDDAKVQIVQYRLLEPPTTEGTASEG